MVDQEVENTLREIRVRVIAESAQASAVARHSSNAAQDSASVVDASSVGAADAARDGAGVEALARLQANLSTTERAWSRLPPVLSYRRGLAAGVEQLRAEQRALDAGQRMQIQTRAAELRSETCERIEHLLEEQRVCFKQLSLEAAEAAVMHDRARRQIEARIEALEQSRERERAGFKSEEINMDRQDWQDDKI